MIGNNWCSSDPTTLVALQQIAARRQIAAARLAVRRHCVCNTASLSGGEGGADSPTATSDCVCVICNLNLMLKHIILFRSSIHELETHLFLLEDSIDIAHVLV